MRPNPSTVKCGIAKLALFPATIDSDRPYEPALAPESCRLSETLDPVLDTTIGLVEVTYLTLELAEVRASLPIARAS